MTITSNPTEVFVHNTLQNPGLTIERLYTTPGVHPYDEVTWERRDVVQTNWKTGEIVFEQRGELSGDLVARAGFDHREHRLSAAAAPESAGQAAHRAWRRGPPRRERR